MSEMNRMNFNERLDMNEMKQKNDLNELKTMNWHDRTETNELT